MECSCRVAELFLILGIQVGVGPLQVTVTWYKIPQNGEKATDWDIRRKQK